LWNSPSRKRFDHRKVKSGHLSREVTGRKEKRAGNRIGEHAKTTPLRKKKEKSRKEKEGRNLYCRPGRKKKTDSSEGGLRRGGGAGEGNKRSRPPPR